GYGGDEWFGGAPRWGLGRRIVAAVRRLAQDRAREGPLASPALLRAAIGPLVPEAVRRALGPLCRNRVGFEWIRPEFAARASLRDRLEPPPAPPFPAPTQRAIYRVVTGAAQVIADELEDRAAHAAGIDQRHPFYDRRIAEFGLALPDRLRCNAGETKVLLRKALGALLPPSVVRRRDKAEFSCTFVEAIVALGGRRIFDRLRSEDAGWVDGRVVRRRCEEMIELYSRGDASYISLSNGLWEIAGLELWLERAGL
ncbi:MAG TPA: asparagine synthase-related protein, partial [Vicinamibacterales bacterium]|nr:asparagine synthase-related protein [Vicinamibacterales bacterium]